MLKIHVRVIENKKLLHELPAFSHYYHVTTGISIFTQGSPQAEIKAWGGRGFDHIQKKKKKKVKEQCATIAKGATLLPLVLQASCPTMVHHKFSVLCEITPFLRSYQMIRSGSLPTHIVCARIHWTNLSC